MALPSGGIKYFRKYLFDAPIAQTDWSLGMVRDRPRSQIPVSGSYQLTDFFVDKPGLLYKRGGTAYQSDQLNDTGNVDIIGVCAPNFPGQPSVIAFVSDSSTTWAYDVTTGSHAAQINLDWGPSGSFPLYVDRVIFTDGLGANPPKKGYIDSGVFTIADLGGSPPNAQASFIHAGRLVLISGSKVYFSPDVDIEDAWDTTNSWIDIGENLIGGASVQGVALLWSRGRCYRITGDIPPGHVDVDDNPDTNMTLEPLGDIGCIDVRTIVQMNNEVFFANESGVYSTNGAGFTNLTNKSDSTGISQLWQQTLQGFSPALGAVVCAGTYQNQYLLLSVLHNDSTRTQFLYYTLGTSWVQTSVKTGATMYATSFAPTTELYFGPSDPSQWSPPQLQKMSGMWTPGDDNKNDADGSPVEPTWTSRIQSDAVGLKRYGFSHLTYNLHDADADDPTLEAAIADGIEADSGYSDVQESPLQDTSEVVRKRFTTYRDTQGLSYAFTQNGPSSSTDIYALEIELAPYFIADGQ